MIISVNHFFSKMIIELSLDQIINLLFRIGFCHANEKIIRIIRNNATKAARR